MTVAPVPLPATARADAARATALITGASSGIGAAYAERLAHDGFDLIIVARRGDRLDTLAAVLRAEEGVSVTCLVADLTAPDELLTVERAIDACTTLAFLINCAGAGGYMPFVTLPPEQAEDLLRLQVVAPTRLTRAALPGMIARGRGAIVNVSSGLAFSGALPAPPLPHRAVYASSKAYINTFSEILADELKGTGVLVQAVCPGLVRTEFHAVAGRDVAPGLPIFEPEDVVTASLAGLQLGEVVCVPALKDPSALADLERDRARVFGDVRSGTVADRYKDLS
jgi:short-subunit dehydrogenase